MKQPNPAIVTQLAARRMPRWVLLLLGLAYVLPGLLGRQPWRQADITAFGVMWDMARFPSHWLEPQVLGQAAEVKAWLPYWLGALAMKALPFLPADLAMRVPFALLLAMALTCTWYAMYHLARVPAALPVSFAFGGEADPTDYARSLADAALLALLASLGLAWLSHESTPDTAQLAFTALLLYACARLASEHATRPWLSALVWWLAIVGLSLSGAPWLGWLLSMGWLAWAASSGAVARFGRERWVVWGICATGTLVAGALAWELELPRRIEVWTQLDAWLSLEPWRVYGRLLLWFTWPAGLLALWTLWRWRQRLGSAHVLLPLWFALAGMGSSWLLDGSDRALLMALPGLACLAAFAMPTLSRSLTALIDWFALIFFTAGTVVIWVFWVSMMTGVPAKPAANVARLAPGFDPIFVPELFVPALLGTLCWLGLLAWRLGRYRPALWKGLVLSASGSTLSWLLLMTLWLPLLNHGMGLEPMSRRIASIVPPHACVLVHGLSDAQITGLQYHGGLHLQRTRTPGHESCRWLVVAPGAERHLGRVVDTNEWRLLANVPRLREGRNLLLVYERQP